MGIRPYQATVAMNVTSSKYVNGGAVNQVQKAFREVPRRNHKLMAQQKPVEAQTLPEFFLRKTVSMWNLLSDYEIET